MAAARKCRLRKFEKRSGVAIRGAKEMREAASEACRDCLVPQPVPRAQLRHNPAPRAERQVLGGVEGLRVPVDDREDAPSVQRPLEGKDAGVAAINMSGGAVTQDRTNGSI